VLELTYGLRDGARIAAYTGIVDECMRAMADAVRPGPHFLVEVRPTRPVPRG
jgi:hypothetical protein